jgi:hypothetical protein
MPSAISQGQDKGYAIRAVDSTLGATMGFDLSSVNWLYVALLSGFVFVAALITNYIPLGGRVVSALIAAVLFAAIFVFATYYPHEISLPTLK